MSFFGRIIKDAIGDGIEKGIRNAVGKATESIVAPKAEQYANKVADSLDEATQGLNSVSSPEKSEEGKSSLEKSLDRLSQSMEKYAEVMEKNVAKQEDIMKEWEEKLPRFPVWCFGGDDFWFGEIGEGPDGHMYYSFNVENATEEDLYMYRALLKENGFVRKYSSSEEVLYKDLGGEYLVFGSTDAFGTAPIMSVTFVRTTDKSEIEG